MMIYKDSYLARPPAVINPRQRLCLEAISFSISSIETEIIADLDIGDLL